MPEVRLEVTDTLGRRVVRIEKPLFTIGRRSESDLGGSVGNTLHELVRAIDLVARGKIVTIVDRTLPLDEFQKGLDALARGELVGRAVLRP